MAKYEYVLLDADNTLFDFDESERCALERTLDYYGYPMTRESHGVYHEANRSLWSAFEQGRITQEEILVRRFQLFLEGIGGGPQDPVEMNARYIEELSRQGHMLPGAEDFCRALAHQCTLAIVTNGVAVTQRGRFDASPLKTLIPHLFISTELGSQKPQRAYFDIVCRELGIEDRRKAVIVGDNLASDIQGGINAGIDTIWYNPKRLPSGSPQATWEVATYEEALTHILKL